MEEKIRERLEELRGMLQADGGDLEVVAIEGKNEPIVIESSFGQLAEVAERQFRLVQRDLVEQWSRRDELR